MYTLVLALAITAGLPVAAQQKQAPYGDISDLKILNPDDKVDHKSVSPPEGAIVLFDGKNLDGWVKTDGKEAAWKLVDVGKEGPAGRAMEVRGGNIMTRQKFGGRFRLHVEFRVPYMPQAKGQARGNSGVYVQGRYEVQVLDSYGLKSQNNDCGGIYEVAAPKVNACKAPTVWQSYDIDFTAPVCENGKKVKHPRMTVWHNGVKIHDNVEVPVNYTRAGLAGDVCQPGPIMLQDHSSPVQYRNIWLLKK